MADFLFSRDILMLMQLNVDFEVLAASMNKAMNNRG
jgi:hypothetical protein